MVASANKCLAGYPLLVTVTYPVFVSPSLPAAFVAVRLKVYVPAEVYWCEGFCAVDVPPSPNDQLHDVGALVDRSVNCTVSGAVALIIIRSMGVSAPIVTNEEFYRTEKNSVM